MSYQSKYRPFIMVFNAFYHLVLDSCPAIFPVTSLHQPYRNIGPSLNTPDTVLHSCICSCDLGWYLFPCVHLLEFQPSFKVMLYTSHNDTCLPHSLTLNTHTSIHILSQSVTQSFHSVSQFSYSLTGSPRIFVWELPNMIFLILFAFMLKLPPSQPTKLYMPWR